MEFGRDQCFRYLVCVSGRTLCAWDVITQSIKWIVNQLPGPVNCLVSDRNSIFMAIVLDVKSAVFVFAPSSSEMLHHEKTMRCGGRAVAAVFVPRTIPLMKDVGRPKLLNQSQLIVVDERQHFYVLDDITIASQDGGFGEKWRSTAVSHMDSLPWTPFAAMQAQQQVSLAKKLVPAIHDTTGVQGFESIYGNFYFIT